MEETDIIICLKKKNKDYKNIKETIVRLKNIFHRCRYGNKGIFHNCYRKDVFSFVLLSFFNNNKSLKSAALFWPYI